MVTQEIMDGWMEGGMVFSNNNFFLNERVFMLLVFYCMNFLH